MATSKRNLNDKIRADYMARVRDALTQAGDEILVTGSNEFAIPCVNAEGDDEFIVITFNGENGETFCLDLFDRSQVVSRLYMTRSKFPVRSRATDNITPHGT